MLPVACSAAESPTASPHSQAVERCGARRASHHKLLTRDSCVANFSPNLTVWCWSHRLKQKKATAEEGQEQQVEEADEDQELEDAMIAARAVAAVRQAEEMVAEPAVRTHTKFDDEGNVVTTYEEQVYDSDGVLRGASSSEDEDDTIGDEMMATIMDASAALETIQFTSGEPDSPVAMRQDTITASEWRGTHTRFDDEDGAEDEVDEMVVGRNKNATVSGKSKGECSDKCLVLTASLTSTAALIKMAHCIVC
jgi:hypothetical protein